MIKQKPLLPCLKEKKRYIAYQLHAEKPLPKNVGVLLVNDLQKKLGIFDSASAGLQNIMFNSLTNKGIIKTSLKQLIKTRMAMLLSTNINKQRIMVQPLLISGILKRTKTQITG